MTNSNQIIDIEEIKKTIPHRFPILLVDRVTDIELNKSIKAYKNITANEDVFNGHFPDLCVYPGVYIIEGLAQASIILGFKSFGLDSTSIAYFAGIDKARFKKPVTPGDKLEYECEIIKMKAGLSVTQAKAFVDGVEVASAELKAFIPKK